MMEVLEILTAFLLSLTFLLLLWTIKGLLLSPVKVGKNQNVTVVIAADKSANNLEREIKSLNWLNKDGRLCADVLIVDVGMDDETAEIASSLSRSNQSVYVCRPDEIKNFIIRSNGYGGEG